MMRFHKDTLAHTLAPTLSIVLMSLTRCLSQIQGEVTNTDKKYFMHSWYPSIFTSASPVLPLGAFCCLFNHVYRSVHDVFSVTRELKDMTFVENTLWREKLRAGKQEISSDRNKPGKGPFSHDMFYRILQWQIPLLKKISIKIPCKHIAWAIKRYRYHCKNSMQQHYMSKSKRRRYHCKNSCNHIAWARQKDTHLIRDCSDCTWWQTVIAQTYQHGTWWWLWVV